MIGGSDLSPATLRLRDLYDILHAFEAAVAFTAGHSPGPDETGFHLVGIKEERGNADCLIAIDRSAYEAAVRCASAVARRDLSELPEKARNSLLAIKRKAKARDWHIRLSDGDGMPTAEIAPDTDFVTDAVLSGPSSIAGTLLRVGGTPCPTASIMLLDGKRLAASVANQDLAVRLGSLLYRVIAVEGEARWRTSDLSLIDFKITGVGQYQDQEALTSVLADLSSIAGDYWDEIDPDEYIAGLRAETE